MNNLIKQFDKLQSLYGDPNLHSVYGGGQKDHPKLCLVFINPTARNIATAPDWQGIRCQWLGTKQIWKFLSSAGLFSNNLLEQILNKKPAEWSPEFFEKVYAEVAANGVYITNLAKCTKQTAEGLPDSVFRAYKNLFIQEMDKVCPQKIVLFGNQVSSIILDQKISVSQCRKKQFILNTGKQNIPSYAVYYPVGNGFFNADKAIEDLKFIINN